MKAIVNTKYGPADVLQYLEVEKPGLRDNEVLINAPAASLMQVAGIAKKTCYL